MPSSVAKRAAPPGGSLLRQSVISVIDQGWLSLLNFAIGLVFIRLATPQDYGVYTQLFAGGVLAVVLAESLLVNPLTTLAAALPRHERDAMTARVNRLHRRLSLVLALGFGVVTAGVLLHVNVQQPWLLALLFATYVHTSARREFQRSVGFLQHAPAVVLRTDLGYGVVLTLLLAAVGLSGELTLSAVLTALTIANLWPLWRGPRLPSPAPDSVTDQALRRQLWTRGRLGLPGALASWIASYSYVYFVAAWLGAAAAAELNAARLLLMPAALLVVAWSRVARPRFSRQIAAGDRRDLLRVLGTSMFIMLSLILCYVAAARLSLPWLVEHVLGEAYASASDLLGVWILYFALYAVRWIGMVLLLCADRYRLLLGTSLVSLGVLVVALPAGMAGLGTAGAVAALAVVEAVQLVIIWSVGVPRVLRQLPSHASAPPRP